MSREPQTLYEWIAHWARVKPHAKAILDRVGSGRWEGLDWAAYLERVRAIAKGLMALGLTPKSPVAMIGANRTDWVCCQFGVAAAGGILAPIYVTNTVEQVAYLVRHSGARIAIADGEALLGKYLAAQAQGLLEVDHFITIDPVKTDDPRVKSLAEVLALGRAADDRELDARLAATAADDVTMLIFTSGTTGLPKGAMYTHANIAALCRGVVSLYPEFLELAEVRGVSYLPLCHAAEQGFTNFLGLRVGGESYFCPDLALLKECLTDVRPTFFLGVPRVWEKFEAALRGRLAQATGVKGRLAAWALRTERASFEEALSTGKPCQPLRRRVANKLVISKLKAALGFDRVFVAVTGAAPISRSTLDFFASIGVPLHEGFGMTETSAFATGQPLGRPRFGTIGRPIGGVEAKIADDGEILLRGGNMVRGYYKLAEASAELWTEDGWMRTGDLGAMDPDGFLRITGRKKDLLITAGGKNVAPTSIEVLLQALPGVGQAVVLGDRRPYLCALLVLDPEAAPALAMGAGVAASGVAALAADPAVRSFLAKRLESDCNSKLARFETIKRFELLAEPFSVEGGELTPTMKVRRNVVCQKYAGLIEAMYAEAQE